MPLTPPPPAFASPSFPHSSAADDAFFSLFLEDEFSKMPPLLQQHLPTTSFWNERSSSSSTHAHSPQPMFGIDPQLVGTPATSKALSDFDEDEECGSQSPSAHEDDEDLEGQLSSSISKPDRSKTSRKGTLMSGGIKKASIVTDKENGGKEGKAKKEPAPLRILEPEDWRPSPEEYKKMSSKEKRQLRNKISARNFRVRRKEYITTLEGDIAERDHLIDAIRTELGSSKSENTALRQEIAALKKCLLEGRNVPDLPPPAELPLSPASPPQATSVTSAGSSGSSVVTPNTQKDLPTSPRLGNRAFWGGLGGMGVTPVHTTFIPPIAVLASKASTPLLGGSPILQPSIFYEETIRPRVLQENINPGLNASSHNLVEKKASANINPALNNLTTGMGIGGFDTFADTNPFTFKTLDAYRMQLWGKMAAQHHHQANSQPSQAQTQSHTPPYSPYSSPSGLAGGLRPHYFTSTPRVGGISPKATAIGAGVGAYATPPAPSHMASLGGPTREQATIAALASQTLLSKLGGAFWEAFSGSSSSSSSSKQWDAEKVRKVLNGSAVVKVVDVEPTSGRVSSPSPVPASVATTSSSPSSSQFVKADKPKGKDCCLEVLEESFRSLKLAKK
ncbi:hypothetical protein BU15DRAFT_89333 [Melanogaster broomeanus]|nr:hypothetical protein BU15DRAFT_89333 [Melanogaster broomeanus]